MNLYQKFCKILLSCSLLILALSSTVISGCKDDPDDIMGLLALAIGASGDSATTPPFRLPDSGQTNCYAVDGTLDSNCGSLPAGQDGNYANTPNSFTLSLSNDNLTVTESSSRLVWSRCLVGQTGSDCSGGTISSLNYDDSVTACSNLTTAGKTWRLPTIEELTLLADFSLTSLDTTLFPNQASASDFWSSTIYPVDTANAYQIQANLLNIFFMPKTSTYAVRCVSGPTVPANQFTDNGDGTISDAKTALLWTKCSKNVTGATLMTGDCLIAGADTPDKVTWSEALDFCENLTHAGRSDWRVPNIRELASIVKYDVSAPPFIDTLYFSNAPPDLYWSSSSNWWTAYTYGYHVGFLSGQFGVFIKTNTSNLRVRCVASL